MTNVFPIHWCDSCQIPTRIRTQVPSMRGGWPTNWATPPLFIILLSNIYHLKVLYDSHEPIIICYNRSSAGLANQSLMMPITSHHYNLGEYQLVVPIRNVPKSHHVHINVFVFHSQYCKYENKNALMIYDT